MSRMPTQNFEHLIPHELPVFRGVKFLQTQAGQRDPMFQVEDIGEQLRAARRRNRRQLKVLCSPRGEVKISGFVDKNVEMGHAGAF
jgi:hypothetical protein